MVALASSEMLSSVLYSFPDGRVLLLRFDLYVVTPSLQVTKLPPPTSLNLAPHILAEMLISCDLWFQGNHSREPQGYRPPTSERCTNNREYPST